MPRKEHIISKTEPLPPFSENLVFYAPLSSKHGFKDLISGTVGTLASTAYLCPANGSNNRNIQVYIKDILIFNKALS